MAYRYKRFYLRGAASLLLIFAMIGGYIEFYDNYEEVTNCGSECWVEFCMKNSYRNLYFYNKEELPLTFSDDSVIHGVEFYKKDGRFKTGYRPIDFIKPYSKGRLYVFKIPAYSYTCYGMKIYKDPGATVKWTFLGLDPILAPPLPYLVNKQTNHTEYWNTSRPVYNKTDKCTWHELNSSWASCTNFSHNEITEHSKIVIDSEWQEVWITGKLFNVTKENLWCYNNTKEIICKSTLDCDGKFKKPTIQKGCSYVTIDLATSESIGKDYLGPKYEAKVHAVKVAIK